MINNPSQYNHFTESNNLQQSTAAVIQPGHENSSNINYNANVDLSMMNNDSIFPAHTNTDHFNQQTTSSISTSQFYPPPITSSSIHSSYTPQYPQQPIFPPPGSFDMTSINPPQSEIFSFDIPGFKIIVIPISSQQDNTYINSSSNILGNQFTQFTQFQQ
jgi:hypothetical protein